MLLVYTHVWLPVLHVGVLHVWLSGQSPQWTTPPQPSETSPQSTPTSHVVLVRVQQAPPTALQTCPCVQQMPLQQRVVHPGPVAPLIGV